MKITKIAIKDFRAFRGEYEIDMTKAGHNLLVYGENGSGKSSLFIALDLFLSSQAQDFSKHKHFRVITNDGYVKIWIGDGTNPDSQFDWDETSNPSSQAIIIEASKSKGFLNYKSLLETHFLQRDENWVNLFNLLVKNLLAKIENPISRKKFGEEFSQIESTLRQTLGEKRKESLKLQLDDFNDGLGSKLKELKEKANEILALFEQNVVIEMTPQKVGFTTKPKKLINCVIQLTANYYNTDLDDYHHFLNETRLSAIALSIYLGGILLNPPSQLQVLALDDVLIGLDMSNRMPLLEILSKYFAQWQLFILTYDWTWYQIVFHRLGNKNNIERAELYCVKTDDSDIPVYYAKNDYLERAEKHLANGDLRAAVVYLRTALEHILKVFCDRKKIAIRYEIEPKHTVKDFWNAIKGKKKEYIPIALATKLDFHLSIVLNPLNHDAYINPIRKDIDDTLATLKVLDATLKAIK